MIASMGLEFLREHMIEPMRIHYTITNGGQAVNVVPERAQLKLGIRGPTMADVEYLRSRDGGIDDCGVFQGVFQDGMWRSWRGVLRKWLPHYVRVRRQLGRRLRLFLLRTDARYGQQDESDSEYDPGDPEQPRDRRGGKVQYPGNEQKDAANHDENRGQDRHVVPPLWTGIIPPPPQSVTFHRITVNI